MLLFRAMTEGQDGLPEIGPSTRTLGVRSGIDVPVQNLADLVQPDQGGMSVSPNDPNHLPSFRRPPEFGGTGKDPVWGIVDDDLRPDLNYRPDPDSPETHGFMAPSHVMTLKEYQDALASTQRFWKKMT